MKTLLRIIQSTCRNCDHRWTSSIITNEYGFPVGATSPGPEVPFDPPVGHYFTTQIVPACHSCGGALPHHLPGWHPRPTRHPSHDAPRSTPGRAKRPTTTKPLTDDELLGDL